MWSAPSLAWAGVIHAWCVDIPARAPARTFRVLASSLVTLQVGDWHSNMCEKRVNKYALGRAASPDPVPNVLGRLPALASTSSGVGHG